MTNLQYLWCYTNKLKSLNVVSSLTKLKKFACSNNQLTYLPSLKSMTELAFFDCSYNQLSDLPTLPDSLTTLYCTYNYLNNDICTDLYQLASQDVGISYNPQRNGNINCSTQSMVYIPSTSFKSYLVSRFDSDRDGEISYSEALKATSIDMF